MSCSQRRYPCRKRRCWLPITKLMFHCVMVSHSISEPVVHKRTGLGCQPWPVGSMAITVTGTSATSQLCYKHPVIQHAYNTMLCCRPVRAWSISGQNMTKIDKGHLEVVCHPSGQHAVRFRMYMTRPTRRTVRTFCAHAEFDACLCPTHQEAGAHRSLSKQLDQHCYLRLNSKYKRH